MNSEIIFRICIIWLLLLLFHCCAYTILPLIHYRFSHIGWFTFANRGESKSYLCHFPIYIYSLNSAFRYRLVCFTSFLISYLNFSSVNRNGLCYFIVVELSSSYILMITITYQGFPFTYSKFCLQTFEDACNTRCKYETRTDWMSVTC